MRVQESGREDEESDRGRREVEKQDAALEVNGVSCYVLLSTLGRSPAPTALLSLSLFRLHREKPAEGEKNIILNPTVLHPQPKRIIRDLRHDRDQGTSFRDPCEKTVREKLSGFPLYVSYVCLHTLKEILHYPLSSVLFPFSLFFSFYLRLRFRSSRRPIPACDSPRTQFDVFCYSVCTVVPLSTSIPRLRTNPTSSIARVNIWTRMNCMTTINSSFPCKY